MQTNNQQPIVSDARTTRSGFVVLIAVLVASLLISLGAFIANIAVKELALSISGRDSQIAFYAADSALECALYADLKSSDTRFSSPSDDPTKTRISNVWCAAENRDVCTKQVVGGRQTSEFSVSFAKDGENKEESPYARVVVTKISAPQEQVIIQSRGYNVKGNAQVDGNGCQVSSASNPPIVRNRVERALEVKY